MPFSIEPFRRPVDVLAVTSSLDALRSVVGQRPEDPEWLAWEAKARTEPVAVGSPALLLDAFSRLARPIPSSRRLRLAVEFAETFGPWAFCAFGDVHADFDPRGLGGVPQTREQEIARADYATRTRRPMRPPRGTVDQDRRPVQWIPGMLVSADRVNALRGIVASVMQGRRADPRLWRILWPTGSRRPFGLGSIEDEVEGARFLVSRWLQAEHVEYGLRFGLPEGRARVGGVAGALAVALADELDPRNRVSRCVHRLRDGRCGDLTRADERGAQRCGVTWRPGRRTKGGGLPSHCPTCDNLHRVTVHRINQQTARASVPASVKS